MMKSFARLGIVTLFLIGGCTPPGEGERCNPMLFTTGDQCTQGLSCVYPTGCGVAYCCPAKVTATTSSQCQPCTSPDGGAGD